MTVTRKEAIHYFEKLEANAKNHADDFERLFQGQKSAYRKDAELYGMALSALREQEERENAEPQSGGGI